MQQPIHNPNRCNIQRQQRNLQSNRTGPAPAFKNLSHSEPILSATGASNSCTIVANVDKVTEIIFAALAMSSAPDSTPFWMSAVMMLSKHGLDLVHSGFSVLGDPRAVADICNFVCAIDEALFVPLRTGACLPRSSTYVTEFGSAVTSIQPLVSCRRIVGWDLAHVI